MSDCQPAAFCSGNLNLLLHLRSETQVIQCTPNYEVSLKDYLSICYTYFQQFLRVKVNIILGLG